MVIAEAAQIHLELLTKQQAYDEQARMSKVAKKVDASSGAANGERDARGGARDEMVY